MAFVVEDGSGLATANAFISEVFADGYFSERNNVAWTGTQAVKQAAIIRATDFMEKRYRKRWKGQKKTATQALAWPRVNVVDHDGFGVDSESVPVHVQRATAEYALRELTAPLQPDPVFDASGSRILEKREKVGPIEEDTKFDGTGPQLFRRLPAADALLTDLLVTVNAADRA